jgi:hypothetical protein
LNKKVTIDSNLIHYKQASITGSFSSAQSHLKKASKIIKNKAIDFLKFALDVTIFEKSIDLFLIILKALFK